MFSDSLKLFDINDCMNGVTQWRLGPQFVDSFESVFSKADPSEEKALCEATERIFWITLHKVKLVVAGKTSAFTRMIFCDFVNLSRSPRPCVLEIKLGSPVYPVAPFST